MKKIFLAIILVKIIFLQNLEVHSQNLISNPGFESGTIPTAESQVNKATGWVSYATGWNGSLQTAQLGTPDLFDKNTSSCQIDVPSNKWGNMATQYPSNRYVGMSGGVNVIYGGTYHYGESVLGTLTGTLSSTCTYTISGLVARIQGYGMSCGNTPNPQSTVNPANKIEVVLRNGSNYKVIFVSNLISSTDWTTFSGNFTLTATEASKNYNKIEFRLSLKESGTSGIHAVYLDDVSLVPYNNINANFTASSSCNNSITKITAIPSQVALNNNWQIYPCNQSGNVTGSIIQNTNSNSNPFIFSTGLNPNSYYKVIHIGSNSCVSKQASIVVNTYGFASLSSDFQLTGIIPVGNTTTFEVTATVLSVPTGSGFTWQVEEIDANGNVIAGTQMINPSNWWNSSLWYVNKFPGYYGNSTIITGKGTFYQGHKYRVSRGTWSNCNPWTTTSKVIFVNTLKSGTPSITVEDDFIDLPEPNRTSESTQDFESSNMDINIYPNPSYGLVNFELNDIDCNLIQIMDITGKVIIENKLNDKLAIVSINMTNYPKGIYIAKIYNTNNIIIKKIIKN